MTIAAIFRDRPSKTSVSFGCIVKRQSVAWHNSIGDDNPVDYVAADGMTPEAIPTLVDADLAWTGTTADVTWVPDNAAWNADGGNTILAVNGNNHPTDGKVDFTVSGLTQGDTVTGYLEVNSGASYRTRVRISAQTIPVGDCGVVFLSCMGTYYPNMFSASGDYGTWRPIGQLIGGLDKGDGIGLIVIVDDGVYQSQNGAVYPSEATLTPPFAPTKTVTDTAAQIVRTAAGLDATAGVGNGRLANEVNLTTDRTQANGWNNVHGLTAALCSPAFQEIAKLAPIVWMPQDHDYITGNDYDFTQKQYASLDDAITAYNNTSAYFWQWWNNPDSFDPTPAVGELPDHLTQGVNNADAAFHLPRYFKVELDNATIVVPDTQTHRTFKGNTAGSLLGSRQLAAMQAEFTALAATSQHVIVASPMVLIRSVNNNTQSWVSSAENHSAIAPPSAPAERNLFMTAIKSVGRDVMIWTGDTHFMQMASDTKNILQMTCGPVMRYDVNFRARYQHSDQTNVTEKWSKQDDAFLNQRSNDPSLGFPDADGTYHFSGQHEDSAIGAVIDADPFSTDQEVMRRLCGFGHTLTTANTCYHMQFDVEGNLASGEVIEQVL